MVVRLADQAPRKASCLRRNRTMEIGFSEDGFLEVRAPREAFKNASSSVLRHMDADRPLRIDDHDDLYREFCGYLSAREVLLNGTADPGTLFVKNMASRAKTPEVSKQVFYENFVDIVRRYGIFNPFNGQGAIRGLRPHGPHAGFRDVKATHILKTGGSVSLAADALLDSEEMIREHYGRYLPQDRFTAAREHANRSLYGGAL